MYSNLPNNSNENTPEHSLSNNHHSNNNYNSNNNTQSQPDQIHLDINTTNPYDSTNNSLMKEGTVAVASSTPQTKSLRINFRTLTGQIMSVSVPSLSDLTILQLKQRVESVHSIPVNFQRLIFGGRELQDPELCSNYNLENESMIHLLLRQNTVPNQPMNDPNNPQYQPQQPAFDPNGQPINYGLPVPVDQHGVPLNLPAMANVPQLTAAQQSRMTILYQLARIVKMFTIIDLIFLVIWSINFLPLAAGLVLALAGYYGAQTYKRNYVACYLLYIVLISALRIYWITVAPTILYGVLLGIGVLIEIYIGTIVWRFLKQLKGLTETERLELINMQRSMHTGFYH